MLILGRWLAASQEKLHHEWTNDQLPEENADLQTDRKGVSIWEGFSYKLRCTEFLQHDFLDRFHPQKALRWTCCEKPDQTDHPQLQLIAKVDSKPIGFRPLHRRGYEDTAQDDGWLGNPIWMVGCWLVTCFWWVVGWFNYLVYAARYKFLLYAMCWLLGNCQDPQFYWFQLALLGNTQDSFTSKYCHFFAKSQMIEM